MPSVKQLASYRRCTDRIEQQWPAFLAKRTGRLKQQERWGTAAEKVAENIVEDLLTHVLDWPLSDLNNQIEYADIELTNHGIKSLIVEVKRPGALAWNRQTVDQALAQAWRYADEQRVHCIAVSDGGMFYAANIRHGGLRDRLFVSLESTEAPLSLWWISVDGIYRPIAANLVTGLPTQTAPESSPGDSVPVQETLLHPKYKIPMECFAYVGHAEKTSTWHLPIRLADGSVDEKRLPKAIQSVLSNYRGAHVRSIPEADIPAVLHRLAEAATLIGRYPPSPNESALAYRLLAEALDQLDR